MRIPFIIIFLLGSFIPSAGALPEGDYSICPDSSSFVQYKVFHAFHDVVGKSKSIEGRIILSKNQGQLMIRVPVASFDSGNSNRDAHMKEVTAAHKHPYVVFKGELSSESQVSGALTFHGVHQPLASNAIVIEHPKKLEARVQFKLNLEAFKIDRPSLLFSKIDDEMRMEGTLFFCK